MTPPTSNVAGTLFRKTASPLQLRVAASGCREVRELLPRPGSGAPAARVARLRSLPRLDHPAGVHRPGRLRFQGFPPCAESTYGRCLPAQVRCGVGVETRLLWAFSSPSGERAG